MAYKSQDVTALYEELRRARKAALDAGLANRQAQLSAQIPGINQAYDALRSQTYTNARTSALGENEALAARGLAGSASAMPTSGYSETSRISQNNALLGALNQANLQQRAELGSIGSQMSSAQLSRDQDAYALDADMASQESSAQQQAYQQALAKAQAELQNYGKVVTQETADILGMKVGDQTESARQAAYQSALAKAQAELQNYGRVVTQETADILGMKIGDQTESARQAAYQNALAKAQAEIQMFGKVMTQETADFLHVPIGTKMKK